MSLLPFPGRWSHACMGLLSCLLAACSADGDHDSPAGDAAGSVVVGEEQIVMSGSGGKLRIQRRPLRLEFLDAGGNSVLASTSQSTQAVQPRVPLPERSPGGADTPQQPPLYAPFSFIVGTQTTAQFPGGFWAANLLAAATAGIEYRLEDVTAVEVDGATVAMQVSTSDPSGRTARVVVKPDTAGTFKVSVRLDPVNQQVALIAAAFTSGPEEGFHGFGGRRNAINQRGLGFLNWAEEFAQRPDQFAPVSNLPVTDETYQFPTGAQGAYYVQSTFISSRDYGFLLERDELSHWRMASDREDAWQVEVAGPELDFVVAPGDSPSAIAKLTTITGRHPVPPEWALGPMLSETVQVTTDTPESYHAKVAESLAMIDELDLPLSAFLFEGWIGLEEIGELEPTIAFLRERDIKPVTYFKGFVDNADGLYEEHDAFEEAVLNGYVASNALGLPFLFGSALGNGQYPAAFLDFTNPATIEWWQGRLRRALDLGIEGWMQDFGEQAFVDMVFHDGRTGLAMHNGSAVPYHKATRDLLDAYVAEHPEREPWFYVRYGYTGRPGSAAYEGASWPGDNTADWSRASGIASVIPDMLNRSLGGAYGFVSEIGGYIDTTGRPEKELVIRWAQLASLSPVHRLHGGPVNGTHMPWRYDQETVDAYLESAQRHIAAQPLIMRLWREARDTGMPITRPLWLAFPDDPEAAAQDQQFLLGDDILVAPVVTAGATSREVYFPAGCWRHPEFGDEHIGPARVTVEAPLNVLPYYFRCATQPFAPPGA